MMTSPEERKYCLESSFIIDLLNGRENAVRAYEEIKNAPLTITAIASVALFEILRGEEENQDKVKAFEELRTRLVVLPFGEQEAEKASSIEKQVHENGRVISPIDLLIASTAIINNAILVSNDSGYQVIHELVLKTY